MLKLIQPDRFLAEHWQKRALFMSGAVDHALPSLGADELAWLATLPDVESRLVFTERDGDRVSYRLEHGPFGEPELGALPSRDWTLLIQDVDKHLPDFRAWFRNADFIPDWRIDDLMISFAAPGGSVGPHRDSYDVFLCQGEGTREWLIGAPQQAVPDEACEGMSLLNPFTAAESFHAVPGDVLYLPPGIPHWGIAQDFCMTYSIGMRAPTKAELELGAARVGGNDEPGKTEDAEQIFYQDGDLVPEESGPGKIHPNAIRRVREQGLLDASLSDLNIARILGSVVTDPKAWLMPDPVVGEEAAAILESPCGLVVHGMARIAWYEAGTRSLIFLNGAAREVNPHELELAQELCKARHLANEAVAQSRGPKEGRKPLTWMLAQGLIDNGTGVE